MDFRNSFIISKKRKLKYIRHIWGGWRKGSMVQNQYYKSVHDVSGLLQPGSLNQLLTLIYKFPIRSTLNFYLLKKMPYILALKISYNLFKVLINNEVKMYIKGENHQTVWIWFNWRYLLHNKQQIIKFFIVHKNVFRISKVIFYL